MDVAAILTALGLDAKTVALIVALATPLWLLLKAVVPLIKSAKLRIVAEAIVRLIEQTIPTASNDAKKKAAVDMVKAQVPKLKDEVAAQAVEAAVHAVKAPLKAVNSAAVKTAAASRAVAAATQIANL